MDKTENKKNTTTMESTTGSLRLNTSRDTLERYQLVSIDGLKSDEGKKLNGGLGILIDGLNLKDGRYPVRIFALSSKKNAIGEEGGTVAASSSTATRSFVLISSTQDKKLKIENVVPINKPSDDETVDTIYQQALREQINKAQGKSDNVLVTFWLSSSYFNQPDKYHYTISYANALSIQGDHKQAVKVTMEFLENCPQQYLDPSNPEYTASLWLKEAVTNLCNARMNIDKALELALKMPMVDTTPENKTMSDDAVVLVANTCKKIIIDHRGLNVDRICLYNLEAAKALIRHDPQNAINQDVLGGAYCLAGNNWEGVKWYRKAAAQGRDVKRSLILAQMQCPGMLFENHYAFPEGRFIHNRDKKHLRLIPGTDEILLTGHVDLLECTIPEDPDDPIAFSSILEKLASEEGQIELEFE